MGTAQWSDLFAKHDFFHKYRYYLQVIASTGDPDLHIKWWAPYHLRYHDHLTTSVGLVLLSREYGNSS